MKSDKFNDLRNKILKGIEIAYEKLVQSKIQSNGELVFSENGQIVIVKAVDLKK